MSFPSILSGALHDTPEDLKKMLRSNASILEKWNALTPLARNEWICWTTIVKKEQTRTKHIDRLHEDVLAGKRRPCCWAGCPHRKSAT